MKKFIIATFCMLGLWAGTCFAQTSSADVGAQVEFVLAAVAKSDMIFIRNGELHTGKEAAEHMRAKYNHYKKNIKTTDDFIRLSGTKSLVSGKPYMVKTKDGKELRSDEWLRSIAAKYKEP